MRNRGFNPLTTFVVIFITLMASIIAISAIDSPFPTAGQRRSVQRLLGPLGTMQYRFDHQVERILSPDDVSSFLFQNNDELKLPFRTQFILSHQRRETMVKRMMFEIPSLTSFILPATLDMNQLDFSPTASKTGYKSTPYFSTAQKLVLNLLQQLQSPLATHLGTSDEKLSTQSRDALVTLNNIRTFLQNNGNLSSTPLHPDIETDNEFQDVFDFLLQPTASDILPADLRAELLSLYKSHLNTLFASEQQHNFVLSDLGSTSPLFFFNGIHPLNKNLSQLPILLLELPIEFTNNQIVQRFIKNNPTIASLPAINSLIMTVQAQTKAITYSHKLLSALMTDIGSTAYIYDAQQYNFWLQFLTTSSLPFAPLVTPNSKHLSINQYLSEDIYTPLAIHPYFMWDAYRYPISKPSHSEFISFDQTHFSTLKSFQTLSQFVPLAGVYQQSPQDIKSDQFYEEFCHFELTFNDPIISLSSQHLNGIQATKKLQTQQRGQEMDSIFESFLSLLTRSADKIAPQTHPHSHGNNIVDFTTIMTEDDEDNIRKFLPTLHLNAFYTHSFYTRSNQEELLLSNIDLHGVVTASLHTLILNNISTTSIFKNEIAATLVTLFNATLLHSSKYNSMVAKNAALMVQFDTFINTVLIPMYTNAPANMIYINPYHQTWLLDIVESNKDTILTPEQRLAVKNGSKITFFDPQTQDEDLYSSSPFYFHPIQGDPKFNLNGLFMIFQTIYNTIEVATQARQKVLSSTGFDQLKLPLPRYNGITLPISVKLESQMNDFLQSYNSKSYNSRHENNQNNQNNQNNVKNKHTMNPITQIAPPSLFITSSNSFFSTLSIYIDVVSNSVSPPHYVAIVQSFLNDQCSECLSQERLLYNELRQGLEEKLVNFTEPICRDVFPFIVPYMERKYCDITIPNECYNLCHGLVHVFKESIADLIAFMSHGPERTCFQSSKCPTNPDTVLPFYPQYQLPSNPGTPSASSIFHISDIHFDAEYSREEGSRVTCLLPVCCFKSNTTITDMSSALFSLNSMQDSNSSENILKSFSLSNERALVPRKYGEYLCDSPEILVHSAVEQILLYCTSSLVYTGDSPAHDLWRQDHDKNVHAEVIVTDYLGTYANQCTQYMVARLESLQNSIPITRLLNSNNENDNRFLILWESLSPSQKTTIQQRDMQILHTMLQQKQQQRSPHTSFSPDLNLASKTNPANARRIDDLQGINIRQTLAGFGPQLDIALGNHAASPVNMFTGLEIYDSWLLDPLAKLWGKYITPQAQKQVRSGAFYVQPSRNQPNIYYISLHTGLYDPLNIWRVLELGHWDTSAQMHFLEDALAQITKLGGKAFIIVHEPHGDAIKHAAAAYQFALYRKYKNTIINILAGHEHHDYTMTIHSDFPVNITSATFQSQQYYQQHLQTPYAFNMDTLYTKGFHTERNDNERSGGKASPTGSGSPHHQYQKQQKQKTQQKKKPIQSLLIKAPHSAALLLPYTKYNTNQFTLTSILSSYHTYLDLNNAVLNSHNRYGPATTTTTTSTSGVISNSALSATKLQDLQPLLLELLPSSITPLDYNTNPAFRVYTMDKTVLASWEQHVFDLDTQPTTSPSSQLTQITSNKSNEPKPEWKVKYTSKIAYPNLKNEITAQNWHNMILGESANMASQFWADYTLRYWGFVPEGLDPLSQEPRWAALDTLCAIFTHSKIEEEYCIAHWNDQR